MNLFGFYIYKEKRGVISDGPCWCCWHSCYLYTGDTFLQLVRNIVKYWKDDICLIG